MTITLTGIYTPPFPETRDLAMIEVIYKDNVYQWQMYVPREQDIQSYIDSQEVRIIAEIEVKEQEWAVLEPKYREIQNPLTGELIKIEILKEDIVKPEIPDYYAKRRDAYPAIGDQLDALWRGTDSPEFQALITRIQEVKATYPK